MSEIKGVARFKFHEGKVEEFKRLSAQAMDIVRAKDTRMARCLLAGKAVAASSTRSTVSTARW